MVLMNYLFLWSIFLIYKSIFEMKILIAFISLYQWCYLKYLNFDKILSVYIEYNNYENMYLTGLLMFLFYSCFYLELGVIKENKFYLEKIKNGWLFYLNMVLIVLFMYYGVDGTIGDYSKTKINTLIEYLLLPYTIIFSLKLTKIKYMLVNTVYIFLSVYLVLSGSRVTAIQLIFIIILLNKKFLVRFRNNIGIFLILAMIFIMKIIEKIRNGYNSFSEIVFKIINSKSQKIIINNEADVIYAGAALVGLINDKILTIRDSFLTWISEIVNIFQIEIFSETRNIPIQILKYTPIGGGGIVSSQLYFLGREGLIIIIAYLLGKNIKNLFKGKINKSWQKIYILIIVVSIFRWNAYSLRTLYKMPLYAIIYFYINYLFIFFMKRDGK